MPGEAGAEGQSLQGTLAGCASHSFCVSPVLIASIPFRVVVPGYRHDRRPRSGRLTETTTELSIIWSLFTNRPGRKSYFEVCESDAPRQPTSPSAALMLHKNYVAQPWASMKTALVTLIIGTNYHDGWRELCEPGWRAYAERHGYDLIAIDRPLDNSARALSRSPAWQKCLILSPFVCGGYDRIVWVDSDIIINPAAPSITKGVPIERIGATDEMLSLPQLDRKEIFGYLIDRSTNQRVSANLQSYLDPRDYHGFWGLPKRGRHIVQTGVLVLSPMCHRELLESVYFEYEDKGSVPMSYEMRPLSFEIQERGLEHLIDQRFNALLSFLLLRQEICFRAPFSTEKEFGDFIKHQIQQNYFLHFAGTQTLPPDYQLWHRPNAQEAAKGNF
jgi:hypothetical protein